MGEVIPVDERHYETVVVDGESVTVCTGATPYAELDDQAKADIAAMARQTRQFRI